MAQAAIFFFFFFHQTAAQNPDARWLMKWKPSATLLLFLHLNRRKWSHTRARVTQYRFHVSVFNHIRAVSKPNAVASSLIISRLGPLTQNVQNCGFVVRSHLALCRSGGFSHGSTGHHTIAFCCPRCDKEKLPLSLSSCLPGISQSFGML